MSTILTKYNNIEQRLKDQPKETMKMIENDIINHENDIPYLIDLNIIIFNNIEKFTDNFEIIADNNYYNILKVCRISDYFVEECSSGNNFIHINGSTILYNGDNVEIFQIYIEFNNIYYSDSNEYEEYELFTDFKTLLNIALVYGREKTMQYALNNQNHLELYEYLTLGDYQTLILYPFLFNDTINYAIIGNNLNCISTIIDIYIASNTIMDKNWESYFKFAAIYGNMEIINYFLVIKPFMQNIIEDFYNKMLQYALCNANIEVVNWALSNGAVYSQTMETFVNEFNNMRNEYYRDYGNNGGEHNEDWSDYKLKIITLPSNFQTKYHECMELIHSYVC
jgi:hypothetical protein